MIKSTNVGMRACAASTLLSSLGIGPTIASQFAPAVIEYLGALGFSKERDMLARILD